MREKNNTNLERMRELIEQLTEADIAYYKNDAPIMTDLEYDRLTEELASLEHDTGLVLSGSPTQKVSGEILESLAEVRHTKPMLSAGKTKSIEDLIRFAAGRAVLLSWKMDGTPLVFGLRKHFSHSLQGIGLLQTGIDSVEALPRDNALSAYLKRFLRGDRQWHVSEGTHRMGHILADDTLAAAGDGLLQFSVLIPQNQRKPVHLPAQQNSTSCCKPD